jgi:putative (di)nucleoside polyphosphate hydrolase
MTDPASLPYRPCVGVMLATPDGRVFVGERHDLPGAWQMPQGGIDKGETVREAGLRELHEETGVAPHLVTVEAETRGWHRYDLPDDLIGKAWGGRFRGQEQKWVLLRFHGTDADIDIATRHPEFSRWCWLAPDEVLAQITTFKRDVYARVFAEFAPRLRG